MTEIEFINKESKKHRPRKFYLKWGLFLLFLGIFVFLVYTSFFGGMGFTGSVIGGSENMVVAPEKLLDFMAETTVPSLALNGKFEKMEIKGGAATYLQIGDQKFYLGDSKNNYIVLKNYEGEVSFDSGKISKLIGKASEISINGILVTPQSKGTLKINLQAPMDYSMLTLINEVLIRKAMYTTTGTINVGNGKNAIHISNEQISITNFKGNLEILNGKFSLAGKIQGFDVSGETNVHIGS